MSPIDGSSKYALERLALYRDFLNEMEHVRLGERFERGLLERQMSMMEVLSSRDVAFRAAEAFEFGEEHWGIFCGDEESPVDDEDILPFGVDDIQQHFLETHLYRFIRTVRKELSVTTEWKPMVIRHKGEPVGIPEDVQEIKDREEREARPWWRRMFGG